ncbi:hypothetical protein ACFU8W_34430 [Streptomyces sp. NPDC057565]
MRQRRRHREARLEQELFALRKGREEASRARVEKPQGDLNGQTVAV